MRTTRSPIADWILVQSSVTETIHQLMLQFDPALVGLSIMTFQRHTASALIDLIERLKPDGEWKKPGLHSAGRRRLPF